jgi:hypothetical protein
MAAAWQVVCESSSCLAGGVLKSALASFWQVAGLGRWLAHEEVA